MLSHILEAGSRARRACGEVQHQEQLQLTAAVYPTPSATHAVGVFPFKTVVSGRKLSMGYVEVATREGCPLFPAGARVRGQVHHHSEIVQVRRLAGWFE